MIETVGYRVVCIGGKGLNWRLKACEKYTVRDVAQSKGGDYYYVVQSDNGEKIGWVSDSFFKPLSEFRLDKLKELGV